MDEKGKVILKHHPYMIPLQVLFESMSFSWLQSTQLMHTGKET